MRNQFSRGGGYKPRKWPQWWEQQIPKILFVRKETTRLLNYGILDKWTTVHSAVNGCECDVVYVCVCVLRECFTSFIEGNDMAVYNVSLNPLSFSLLKVYGCRYTVATVFYTGITSIWNSKQLGFTCETYFLYMLIFCTVRLTKTLKYTFGVTFHLLQKKILSFFTWSAIFYRMLWWEL